MNYFIYLVVSLVTCEVNSFPQSLSDVAIAVKQTDLNYYNSEVGDLILIRLSCFCWLLLMLCNDY